MNLKKAMETLVTDPGGSPPMRNPLTCPVCNGSGSQSGELTDNQRSTDIRMMCSTCDGTGIIMMPLESTVDFLTGFPFEEPAPFDSARARAYDTLLDSLRHVITERNRFDAEVDRERWRRARLARELRYAHNWITALFVTVAILASAVLILVSIR